MWYRVFGGSETNIDPEAVLEFLHKEGFETAGHFRGDDLGWFHLDVAFGGDAPIEVERYLSSEEGIRAQLNTWAAWLEALPENPYQLRLMQQMISTRQLFTLSPPVNEDVPAQICLALCRFFAQQTDGIYQIDGEGMYASDGTLLVSETA